MALVSFLSNSPRENRQLRKSKYQKLNKWKPWRVVQQYRPTITLAIRVTVIPEHHRLAIRITRRVTLAAQHTAAGRRLDDITIARQYPTFSLIACWSALSLY
jgi:hypothetical protein